MADDHIEQATAGPGENRTLPGTGDWQTFTISVLTETFQNVTVDRVMAALETEFGRVRIQATPAKHVQRGW